jgi:hypothetical protein
MNLSPKALRFMVEALEYRIAAYERQLEAADVTEDEAADVSNDLMFLESILQELNKALEMPIAQVF